MTSSLPSFILLLLKKKVYFNPFMSSGLFYLPYLDQPISVSGVPDQFCLLPCFIEMPVVNANSVDLDQTPHSVAFDLGLHCLLMSHLWDARHKWVKRKEICHKGHFLALCISIVCPSLILHSKAMTD